MSPYDIEECCEAYRNEWINEVLIYIALMLISVTIGYCFGAISCS